MSLENGGTDEKVRRRCERLRGWDPEAAVILQKQIGDTTVEIARALRFTKEDPMADMQNFILAEFLESIAESLEELWNEDNGKYRHESLLKATERLRRLSGFFREQHAKASNPTIVWRDYGDTQD